MTNLVLIRNKLIYFRMGLPPILNFGSDYIKDKVAPCVINGTKNICLAISEPGAGSDVAGIKARAEL